MQARARAFRRRRSRERRPPARVRRATSSNQPHTKTGPRAGPAQPSRGGKAGPIQDTQVPSRGAGFDRAAAARHTLSEFGPGASALADGPRCRSVSREWRRKPRTGPRGPGRSQLGASRGWGRSASRFLHFLCGRTWRAPRAPSRHGGRRGPRRGAWRGRGAWRREGRRRRPRRPRGRQEGRAGAGAAAGAAAGAGARRVAADAARRAPVWQPERSVRRGGTHSCRGLQEILLCGAMHARQRLRLGRGSTCACGPAFARRVAPCRPRGAACAPCGLLTVEVEAAHVMQAPCGFRQRAVGRVACLQLRAWACRGCTVRGVVAGWRARRGAGRSGGAIGDPLTSRRMPHAGAGPAGRAAYAARGR